MGPITQAKSNFRKTRSRATPLARFPAGWSDDYTLPSQRDLGLKFRGAMFKLGPSLSPRIMVLII